jgi:hypothetical protein
MSFISKIAKFAAGVDNFITGGVLTRKAINSQIKEYGEMIEFKLDNKAKKISLKILLNGEESPIDIDVDEYVLQKNGEVSEVTVKSVSSDRKWIDAALQNFVVGKSFKLPGKVADFADDFLG